MHPFEHAPASKFETDNVQRFLKFREIRPEHFDIVKELLNAPKNQIIIRFHNFFSAGDNEETKRKMLLEMQVTRDAEYKRQLELFLEIVTNYDWTAAYNLVGVLEKA